MTLLLSRHRIRAALCGLAIAMLAPAHLASRQPAPGEQAPARRFGGAYAELEPQRQLLVDDWVARFVATTGQQVEAAAFYDDVLRLSSKTTFDAVTHALMTTPLTDRSGASLGGALDLVEHVEAVNGEINGAAGDHQFRMYVRLRPDAIATLTQSQQFRRGVDNTVYHQGYPINYRQQGGVPSIQISIARDRRQADIDVDYRSSRFPAALFNGHLSSSNSDVRAGNNSDRHVGRWAGLQNWWRGFFGLRATDAPEDTTASPLLAYAGRPRVGVQPIDAMVRDFLQAWLVEGDVAAAMGYVSERAFACLALEADDPSAFDRGMAPFRLMMELKAVHDTLVPPTGSLEDVAVGVRLTNPILKVVNQPRHAQFVLLAAPDDVAARLDCGSRVNGGDTRDVPRVYGNYFVSTFYIRGQRNYPLALLWAIDNGYWKVVSWSEGSDAPEIPPPVPAVDAVVRIPVDESFAQAARDFLESWFVRRDYDAAFGYLSPASYACYDLERAPDDPPSTSVDDAGRKIRATFDIASRLEGRSSQLETVIAAADPVHPLLRVMDHPRARTFTLVSMPNVLADMSECAARAADDDAPALPDTVPLEYGEGYSLMFRFSTQAGDAPVLRTLWRRDNDTWRITSYTVEMP